MSDPRQEQPCLSSEQFMNTGSSGADASPHRPSPRTLRIRALNDRLRREGLGGMIVGTRGFLALEPAVQVAVLAVVRNFEAFTAANDPWGEHDCAVVEVQGVRIIWKIDAYERSLTLASPDPADPKVTRRVLTLMLADEY